MLSAFGINHHSASIDFREKVSFSDTEITTAIRTLAQTGLSQETVIFSTCNRTEFYFAGLMGEDDFYAWLSAEKALPIADIKQHSYFLRQPAASAHLFRVASGLDSIALGEPQILGQIKAAYQLAKTEFGHQKQLNYLFEEAFHVAKNVRSTTQLGENSISIAYAALKLADLFFAHYENLTALVIGAGETGELVTKILQKKSLGKIIVANRTLEKAQALAQTYSGEAAMLSDVPALLAEADIIISATNKAGYTVSTVAVKTGMQKRKKRMQLFLDLAVPRDIEPSVKQLDNSYLYAVDDLDDIIKNNQELRQSAAAEAEMLVEQYNQQFLEWINLRKNNSLLKQLHEHAQSEKEKLLQDALKQLQSNENTEQVLATFATKLTKKLTHQPSLLIRRACQDDNKALLDDLMDIYHFKR